MLEENFRSCEASGEEIREQRRTRAFPVMDAMKAWMESVQHRCTPDDPPGKALEYAYKLWSRMRRYADDGQCQLDNNPVERGTKAHRHGTRKLPLQQTNEGAVTMGHIFTAGKLRNRRSKPAQMDGTCARQAQTRQHRGRTCKVTPLQLLLKHVEFRMVTMRSPPAICLLLTKCRLPSVVSSFGGLTMT